MQGNFIETRIRVLRDKNSTLEQFRTSADEVSEVLAIESGKFIQTESCVVETPLAETTGIAFVDDIVLIPILRSGLVLLPAFLKRYPNARVGFIGARRDEKTAVAEMYYKKLPAISKNSQILILDPMIATGGSVNLALETILVGDAQESNISLIGCIASPIGLESIQKKCPKIKILIAQIDQGLDKEMRIVPGLGDFGDRYFGTL